MDANLHIREATAEDAEALKKCMESAYAPYQERMGGKRLPPMNVDYAAEIENYPVWIVDSRGRVLGGLIMDFENGKASIANIAISPDFQGRGMGGKLIQYAEEKAREQNFSELHLATHVLLDENISLLLQTHSARHPVLVIEVGGRVVGWASLTPWSDRKAYEDTAESTLYIDPKYQGHGFGCRLTEEIVNAARRLGFHTLIARIAEGSDASVRLHEGCGFERIGTMKEVGRKFDRLLDVYVYQKMLK